MRPLPKTRSLAAEEELRALARQPGPDVRCGLTVYARGHIGNFRTFVSVDVLRRALKYQEQFDVLHVMNFTDVDDRTIARVEQGGRAVLASTLTGTSPRFARMPSRSASRRPSSKPRATDDENIKAMAETIVALEQRGHTLPERRIHLLQDSPASLTTASSRQPRPLRHQERRTRRQRQVRKRRCPGLRAVEGQQAGRSRCGYPGVGAGRPGWHIECSAMALRLLGAPIQFPHAGGVDLIFPHPRERDRTKRGRHRRTVRALLDARRALDGRGGRRAGRTRCPSRSATCCNLEDIRAQGFRPSALRYLYLVHYRKQLKFSWTAMAQAEEAIKRLTDFLARLGFAAGRAGARGRHDAARRGAGAVPGAHRRRSEIRRRESE